MKALKKFCSLITLAVAVSMPVASYAKGGGGGGGGGGHASSSSHSSSSSSSHSSSSTSSSSGSSHSFSSGFSSSGSSKSSLAASPSSPSSPSAPAAAPRSSGNSLFGSFGSSSSSKSAPAVATPVAATATPTAPAQKSTSALTSNLEKNAAQTTALRTLDARNAKSAPAAESGLHSGAVAGSGAGYASNVGNAASPQPTPQYGGYSSAPPTVVYQNSGSSSNGLMWFMLGRSVSGGNHSYSNYDANRSISGAYPVEAGNSAASADSGSSAGLVLLRILAWTALLGGMGAVIWYFVKRASAKAALQASKHNYSL